MLQGQKTYLYSSASGRNFKLKSETDLNTYCHNSFVYLMSRKLTVHTGNVTAGKSNGFRSIVNMFQSICVPNLNALPHGKLHCRVEEEWELSKRQKRWTDHTVAGVSQTSNLKTFEIAHRWTKNLEHMLNPCM